MDRLSELKQKYAAAIQTIVDTGVHLENLHVKDNKLFMKGTAPSEQAKNQVWTAVKAADASYGDLQLDLTIDPSLTAPTGTPAGKAASGEQSYTVKSGDTLSKISRQFYGDANEYMKIFEANRTTLSDPDKIKPGQVLKIPA